MVQEGPGGLQEDFSPSGASQQFRGKQLLQNTEMLHFALALNARLIPFERKDLQTD